MATMNISLPDKMREWVEAQSETGEYASSSDYVRDLIRQHQAQQLKLDGLRKRLSVGAAQAEQGVFVEDYSIEGLLAEMDTV